jgi:hypothetical protein
MKDESVGSQDSGNVGSFSARGGGYGGECCCCGGHGGASYGGGGSALTAAVGAVLGLLLALALKAKARRRRRKLFDESDLTENTLRDLILRGT